MGASRKKERYEVLYEDIKSMVELVLEGHSTLDQKIEALRGDVRGVKAGLGYVEQAVTDNSQRLGVLIRRFESHEHAHQS